MPKMVVKVADVSIFASFLILYRNLDITKTSICCRGYCKLQFSGFM